MRCSLIKKIKSHGKIIKNSYTAPLKNQDGSAILIAMMLLVLMTIMSISASNTSVTESYIIRNVGMHKQNLSLVEAVAVELAQEALINITDPANDDLAESSPVKERWVISDTQWADGGTFPYRDTGLSYHDAWYTFGTNGAGQIFEDPDFDGDGDPATGFPQHTWPGDDFFANNTVASPSGDLTIIGDRGEGGDFPLNMALVGWDAAPGSSLKATAATRKKARILAEYASPRYGLMRLEVGLERAF